MDGAYAGADVAVSRDVTSCQSEVSLSCQGADYSCMVAVYISDGERYRLSYIAEAAADVCVREHK